MGKLMRQYWLPAAKSSELTADGDPLRLKLLGERLIGFRDSNGVAVIFRQAQLRDFQAHNLKVIYPRNSPTNRLILRGLDRETFQLSLQIRADDCSPEIVS